MSKTLRKNSRSETHPLFNPVVLERIFNLLTVKNIKQTRLVCKLWNRLASPFLQDLSEVVLIRGKELDKRKYSYKNFIIYLKLQTLRESEEDSIFFRNYHIEHWILNLKRERSLLTFWLRCGPTLKELHLRDIIFYEIETIRNVFYHWTPNLESLRVENCLFYTITSENLPNDCKNGKQEIDEDYVFFDYYDHVTVEQLVAIDRTEVKKNPRMKSLIYDQLEGEDFPLAWEELFDSYCNLKTLKIAASVPEDQISKIVEGYIKACTENEGRTPLEEFSFCKARGNKGPSKISNYHLYILCKLPPLKTIEILLSSNNVLLEDLIQFLNTHSSSLEKLCLYTDPAFEIGSQPDLSALTHENARVKINVFENLKILSISPKLFNSKNSKDGKPFPLLNMSSLIFPHLKCLNLWDSENDFNWEHSIDDLISTSVLNSTAEIWAFTCGYLIHSPNVLKSLAQYCCKIKRLDVPLNDEQIRIIFSDMKELEELTVYDRCLTDSGITGNPIQLTEFSEWSGDCQREFPYIGDLKLLRKFTLKYWKYDKITDLSVYHGFKEVVNLGYLHLTKTLITEAALRDLAYKSSLITLISPKVSKGDEY